MWALPTKKLGSEAVLLNLLKFRTYASIPVTKIVTRHQGEVNFQKSQCSAGILPA
jgi:hypothetical protein